MRVLALLLAASVFLPTASAQRDYSASLSVGYAAYGVEGYACDSASDQSEFGGSNCVRTRAVQNIPTRSYRGEGGGGFASVRLRGGVTDRIAGEMTVYSHWETAGETAIQPLDNAGAFRRGGGSWAAGIDLGATYVLREGVVRPTVTGGAGIFKLGKNGSIANTGFGLRPAVFAGAGVEYALTRKVFARVDGRLRHAFDGTETLARGLELAVGVGYTI